MVPEKKIFEGFYHIWAWRSSLYCDQHHVNKFSFHVPKSLNIKLSKNGPMVSEKSKFKFLYVNDLVPRSENDLDLITHLPS